MCGRAELYRTFDGKPFGVIDRPALSDGAELIVASAPKFSPKLGCNLVQVKPTEWKGVVYVSPTDMAHGKHVEKQRTAIWALANLCRYRPAPAWDAISPSIPVIVDILRISTDREVLIAALSAVSCLIELVKEGYTEADDAYQNVAIQALNNTGIVITYGRLVEIMQGNRISSYVALGNDDKDKTPRFCMYMASKLIGYIATGSSEDRWHVIASGGWVCSTCSSNRAISNNTCAGQWGTWSFALPGDVDAQRQRSKVCGQQ